MPNAKVTGAGAPAEETKSAAFGFQLTALLKLGARNVNLKNLARVWRINTFFTVAKKNPCAISHVNYVAIHFVFSGFFFPLFWIGTIEHISSKPRNTKRILTGFPILHHARKNNFTILKQKT
jgi:hypothetical protein